jgi:hypothetical protein
VEIQWLINGIGSRSANWLALIRHRVFGAFVTAAVVVFSLIKGRRGGWEVEGQERRTTSQVQIDWGKKERERRKREREGKTEIIRALHMADRVESSI